MRSYIGVMAGLVGMFGLVACEGFGSRSSEPEGAADAPTRTPGDQLPTDAPRELVGSPSVDELTEKYGVFVTTTGAADGDGTRARPFATIGAAIERVKDLKLRVYVCSGTYKESITLVSGVSVVGGLGCESGTWRTGGARARIESPVSPAVRARDIALGTRFEGFDVTVPAGDATSQSSIAFIAERASKLSIVSSKLAAAKAFGGTDGADGVQLALGASAKGSDGLPFVGAFVPSPSILKRPGQPGGIGSCLGGAGHDGENGTAGGNGASVSCEEVTDFITGKVIEAWVPYNAFGVVYDRSDAVARSGAVGAAGQDGESARTLGALSADGYVPANGMAGADGSPGKGGSGGNGGTSIAGQHCPTVPGAGAYCVAGPGGGAGGCPGLAGTPGTGGGASIAALLFASPGLTFTASELVSADGGNGGMGAFGSEPTAGGAPGAAKNGAPAGSPGGAGGRAGFSGNGAGGPSAAIAHTGGAPVIAPDTKTAAGAGGKGVSERSRPDSIGNVVTIPASADGTSKAVFDF